MELECGDEFLVKAFNASTNLFRMTFTAPSAVINRRSMPHTLLGRAAVVAF